MHLLSLNYVFQMLSEVKDNLFVTYIAIYISVIFLKHLFSLKYVAANLC